MARSLLHCTKSLLVGQRKVLVGMTSTALFVLSLLFLLLLPTKPAIAQAECLLEPGAAACDSSSTDPGSTSPPTDSRRHVGNPIDVLSGNKYQRGDDYAAFASPLVYSRHYNTALVLQNLGLGKGWRDTYSLRLYGSLGKYTLIQSDGRSLLFDSVADDGITYSTDDANDGKLIVGKGVRWVLPDGRVWEFSGSYPVSLTLPDGSGLTLSYKNKQLHTVTDNQGAVLQYFYTQGRRGLSRYSNLVSGSQPGHLECIELPDGTGIRYAYDQTLNLVSVRHADGINWEYQYDDEAFPSHMTQALRQRPQQQTPHGCEVKNETAFAEAPADSAPNKQPWISRWSFDGHGRAVTWESENSKQGLRVDYDVEIRPGAGESPPTFGTVVRQATSEKAYRYIPVNKPAGVSNPKGSDDLIVEVQACNDCEWEALVSTAQTSNQAESQFSKDENKAPTSMERSAKRHNLFHEMHQVGLSLSVNRFGAGKIQLPDTLLDALSQKSVSDSGDTDRLSSAETVCGDWLGSMQSEITLQTISSVEPGQSHCEQLEGLIRDVSLELARSDPVPMRSERVGLGDIIDWLQQPLEPRPPGTCPLPSGMTCEQLGEAITYAGLSECAYETGCPDEGWVEVDPQTLGLSEDMFEIGGFHAVLLYSETTNEYVLSFEGTGLTSVQDWITNAQNYYNVGTPFQYGQAVDLAFAVDSYISIDQPGASLIFTGHSLGGGLASIAALHTQNPAIVFNSAAVGTHALHIFDTSILGHEDLIDVINMSGDPVSNMQADINWPAPGTHYTIGDPNAAISMEAHGIVAVQNELNHLYIENCTQEL